MPRRPTAAHPSIQDWSTWESAGPGLPLIVDAANGYEWLVRHDGTITSLAHDFDEVPAADPRLWFVCLAVLATTVTAAPSRMMTPREPGAFWTRNARTVHVWEGPWEGTDFAVGIQPSLVSPGSPEPVWGYQDQIDDRLIAWRVVDGTRHYQDLGADDGERCRAQLAARHRCRTGRF